MIQDSRLRLEHLLVVGLLQSGQGFVRATPLH